MTDERTVRWYSHGPGGPDDDLPDGVEVWENGEAVPSVNVPPEGPLSVEDTEGIAEAVRIARDALEGWR